MNCHCDNKQNNFAKSVLLGVSGWLFAYIIVKIIFIVARFVTTRTVHKPLSRIGKVDFFQERNRVYNNLTWQISLLLSRKYPAKIHSRILKLNFDMTLPLPSTSDPYTLITPFTKMTPLGYFWKQTQKITNKIK